MAGSKVEICNIALSYVGTRARIASLTESSEEARVCNLMYGLALRQALSQGPWGFATRRKALVLLETDLTAQWPYRYGLPADCVSPLYIEPVTRNPSRAELEPWKLETGDDPYVTLIVTGRVDAVLVYTRSDVPEALYPPHFEQYLCWEVAAQIAMPLTQKEEIGTAVKKLAMAARATAMSFEGNQGQPDIEPDSEFVTERE